jgi:hypothetical protein
MSKDGKVTALVAVALLVSSLSLGGCMTSTAGSSQMDARAEAPALPKARVVRSGANSHDFAPLCIHWNGKVAAAQPPRQRATDYHGCARITVR